MSNMSYCRFENTYRELCDCVEHIEDENLSESEKFYRGRISWIVGFTKSRRE